MSREANHNHVCVCVCLYTFNDVHWPVVFVIDNRSAGSHAEDQPRSQLQSSVADLAALQAEQLAAGGGQGFQALQRLLAVGCPPGPQHRVSPPVELHLLGI